MIIRLKNWNNLGFLTRIWYTVNPFAKIKWLENWLYFYEIDTLPYVYDEITGGTLSYPGYSKEVVIDEYHYHVDRKIQYAIDDFIEDNELTDKCPFENGKWIR